MPVAPAAENVAVRSLKLADRPFHWHCIECMSNGAAARVVHAVAHYFGCYRPRLSQSFVVLERVEGVGRVDCDFAVPEVVELLLFAVAVGTDQPVVADDGTMLVFDTRVVDIAAVPR